MKLSLKNIGKIKEATVEINGITVIAGENNTGKSTVGKTLYSVFNSFYDIENQIRKERIQNVVNLLDMMYRNSTNRLTIRVDTEDIAENIIDNIDRYLADTEALKNEILGPVLQYDENFEKYLENENINEAVKRIVEILSVSSDDIFKTVLNKKLDSEFNGQINNIFSEAAGEIKLQIKDCIVSINVLKNIVSEIENRVDLKTEAIYIDDPFVLDEARIMPYIMMRFKNYSDHRNHLQSKLFISKNEPNVINEIIATNKLDKIYDKINLICSGDVVSNRRTGFGYRRINTEKVLDIRNLSSGLKTFVILKTLLINGTLEFNGTIILDEPEIHLHPEWQLLFAELIVLIQKEFGMHVLLNTHSPYFLNAVEVYAAKYEIADKCKYYLATVKEDYSFIEDVSENIEAIYSKLARPLQDLENERYSDD